MSTTMHQIENLVGVIQLRQKGISLSPFEQYDDVTLAKMLCRLAVTHLDNCSTPENAACRTCGGEAHHDPITGERWVCPDCSTPENTASLTEEP